MKPIVALAAAVAAACGGAEPRVAAQEREQPVRGGGPAAAHDVAPSAVAGDSGIIFYEDFADFDPERPVASWMALRSSGPVPYSTTALARTLRPGGGITLAEPGVLAVTFPAAGGCSGATADDGHPACNGALVTMFDPLLTESEIWITIHSKEGDRPGDWKIGTAYKFLRTTWAVTQIGVGVDIRPAVCSGNQERYFLLAGARTGNSLCVSPTTYDGVWATWELHIGPQVSELYRDGKRLLSIPTGSSGKGGLRYIEWGANMNTGLPAPQTRYFDFFAVSTRRMTESGQAVGR